VTPGDNPFAKDAAKQKKRALAVVAGVVVLVVVILAVRWYTSPDRVMDANRAFIDETRAKYCKALEAVKRGPKPAAPTDRPHVTVLEGWYPNSKEQLIAKPGNADKIQRDELESICGGGETRGGESIHGTFTRVVDTRPYMRDDYKKSGLRDVVGAMKQVEYLVVVTVDQMTASTAVGEKGLAAGRFKATAALVRLSDGAYIDDVAVAGDAPGLAFVERGHEDLQLAIQTDEALEHYIESRFAAHGIDVKMTR